MAVKRVREDVEGRRNKEEEEDQIRQRVRKILKRTHCCLLEEPTDFEIAYWSFLALDSPDQIINYYSATTPESAADPHPHPPSSSPQESVNSSPSFDDDDDDGYDDPDPDCPSTLIVEFLPYSPDKTPEYYTAPAADEEWEPISYLPDSHPPSSSSSSLDDDDHPDPHCPSTLIVEFLPYSPEMTPDYCTVLPDEEWDLPDSTSGCCAPATTLQPSSDHWGISYSLDSQEYTPDAAVPPSYAPAAALEDYCKPDYRPRNLITSRFTLSSYQT